MKWIVITSPKFLQGETHFIPRLFAHGVDLLHLRKPGASIEECSQLLDKIPQEWHNRIVLHSHFELASTYRLHGIHLNHRSPQAPEGFKKSISCSCHSLKEVVHNKPRMNYMFLSPIFDSISKEGYGAAFTPEMLNDAAANKIIDNKVIALGGIDASHIQALKEWHFGGAAFLGDIWNRIDDKDVDNYLDYLSHLLKG